MHDVSAHFLTTMNDLVYCPLTALEIFTYNDATSTFSAFTDSNYITWDTDDLDVHYKTTIPRGSFTYYIKAMTELLYDYGEEYKVCWWRLHPC